MHRSGKNWRLGKVIEDLRMELHKGWRCDSCGKVNPQAVETCNHRPDRKVKLEESLDRSFHNENSEVVKKAGML